VLPVDRAARLTRVLGGALRKLRLAWLVAFVAIVGSAVALGNQTNGGATARDYIEGTGVAPLATPLGTFPSRYYAAAESSGSSGVPARGSWFTDIFPTGTSASMGTVSISGPVICISAAGNGSNWRGIISDTNQPGLAPVGFGVLSRWIDYGEGVNNPPDQQVAFLTSPPGPDPTCPLTPITTGPVVQGDLRVHDGI
jgi:hypothetical protein